MEIMPVPSWGLNPACRSAAWRYLSEQTAASWQLRGANRYKRKLFSDLISACVRQGYSHFMSLILYTVFYCGCFIVESNVSWIFFYFFLNLLGSRKNILFFWDLLAHAHGLVARYKKPFSHRLTFKHTLKSHWNQRALEVRLKLSTCAMLCCKRAMCSGRYLMLQVTWIRRTNFRLVFGDYFVKRTLPFHVECIICRSLIKICNQNRTQFLMKIFSQSLTILNRKWILQNWS